MNYNVFYMNPGATPEVVEMVRGHLPSGWCLTTPSNPHDFRDELAMADFVVVATEAIRNEHLQSLHA